MQVIIEINGRQALPVRAIPLLTDWMGLSPDQLAQILAGDSDHWPSFDGLGAHRLHADGSTEPVPPRRWASWVVGKLQATSATLKTKQTSHETGYQQWRSESLAQLPAGVFVWRDEFEAAHADEYGPEGMRARGNPEGFDPAPHALDFNPQPDPAIAPPSLVLEGFMLHGDAGGERLGRALEWLNAPREELPQEYHDAFALWCEVDAIDRQVRELETTQPVGVTEILARRAALKELHTERARLLAVLEGREQPAPAANASPAPVVADSASTAPVVAPPPVATGDVAHAFDGLRGWNEKAWKDTLGSPPKWLEACIALRGQRGIRAHHWNPVLIGAALVHNGHAKQNSVRARFQTKPQLKDWLEAWKTYEADTFDAQ